MVKKYILGNWKMHGLQREAESLAQAIAAHKAGAHAEIALFPPFTALATVAGIVRHSALALGAQDCAEQEKGAFTGDISASMLKDAGCRYVILGHSERRQRHAESDETVRLKAQSALKSGLMPIICVGESLDQRQSGQHLEHIRAQVEHSFPKTASGSIIVAYEPLWAIGSGKTPTLAEITQVHKTIATTLTYATSGAPLSIVYGGSVKAESARDILRAPGVDGVLVGGASLKASEFCAIIDAAR